MAKCSHVAIAIAIAAALSIGACAECSAESIYLISDGGHAARIDSGVVVGASYVDANQNFTRIAVGNATASSGLQVGVGNTTGGVHVLNGGLTSQIGFVDVNGADNDPVTGVAVGSIGDQAYAIAATHLFYNEGNVALANLRGRAYIFNSTDVTSLSQVGNGVSANPAAPNIFFPNGTPNTYVDVAIGELETSAKGNELVLGHHQLNSDGSRVASAVQEAGKVREVQTLGGVNSVKRDHTMNAFLTGIALGDVRGPGENATPGGPDDFIMFGTDNGAPQRTNRNSWQAFSRSEGAGGFPNFNFLNFNAANQASAIVDGAIGDVFGGAFGTAPDDPAAPDLRSDFVSVGKELNSGGAGASPTGNGVVEISNTFSGGCCLQQIIVPGEELTSVVLADILDSDGVLEIIAGGSLGNLHVFRHSTPGDLTSLFGTTPAISLNVLPVGLASGRVIELAKEFRGAVVPEPSTVCLVALLGLIGVASSRRHKQGQN